MRSPASATLQSPLKLPLCERFYLLIAGLLVSGLVLTSCTRESKTSINVPNIVQGAFATKYPGVSAVWEDQPYGYEATFTAGGIEYEAEYSFTGQWLETEQEVSAGKFPEVVLDRVQRDYPGYTITKYEIELTPQGVFYELEIEQNGNEREIYYDCQGNPSPNMNEDA